MPISFSGVHLVFEVLQDAWHSNKENASASWNAALSYPLAALKLCKSVSRSSRFVLILDADHSLDFFIGHVYKEGVSKQGAL